ncbi:uncharacterized protein LOC122289378 [Carya illinoinensis]|uniref:uncharacterized protein LOC122289378 n=1 Tax=Carya illinoinensis TaxID=32201 RepID=UPI001C719CC3|nr:uncharacterized protein LOC122289378 [Carya illinoinensis]
MYFNMKATKILKQDLAILKRLDILISTPKAKRVSLVKWLPPCSNWVKLNIDGSSLGNPGPAGAGGVIRDASGHMCAAFSVSLGQDSNNYAELKSLLEDYWDELQVCLDRLEYSMSHVFREGNAVADYFAKEGSRGSSMEWFEDRSLPNQLRGLLRMDRAGIPYLRISS